ncbi:cytochrome c551 [Exiguobacterium flavidum]|uniref:cytochrome c551 n=1 Tax=Exiguobacterium flavidum TaxID=2184695 RepID=UPI000DF7796F|nr:cytochrome c [Exiguobacterium flavidum]
MKTKKFLLALGIGATLVLGACGGDDEKESTSSDEGTKTETAIDAEKVFANNCAACHGQNLEGGAGPDLTKVGARLSSAEIQEIIKNGKGAMPKGVIQDEEEIVAVADWLASKK